MLITGTLSFASDPSFLSLSPDVMAILFYQLNEARAENAEPFITLFQNTTACLRFMPLKTRILLLVVFMAVWF